RRVATRSGPRTVSQNRARRARHAATLPRCPRLSDGMGLLLASGGVTLRRAVGGHGAATYQRHLLGWLGASSFTAPALATLTTRNVVQIPTPDQERSRRVVVSAMRVLMSLRTSARGSGRSGSKWSAEFVRPYAATSDDSVERVVPLNGK